MPQPSILQGFDATPAGALVSKCRQQSLEPWLFFRRGWIWRWASYEQVGDQVARGLRIVRQAATSAPSEAPWVTHGTQHPDAVAIACMLLEAGGTLRLLRPGADGSWPLPEETSNTVRWVHAATEGSSPEPSESTERNFLEVPSVPGQLDRRPLETLEPTSSDAQATSRVEDEDGRLWTLEELRERACRLAATLVDGHRPPEAGSRWRRWRARRSLPRRPIVSVSPKVSPVDQLVVAWATLAVDAAWVLEPQEDAFLPAIDWIRPTVVVTDPEAEEELHSRLVALPRGQRRLRSVVGWPPDATESIDPQLWQELEIDRSTFP